MRVIVTGASGFLGYALVHHLKAEGIDCLGVSRRSDVNELLSVVDYSQSPVGDVLVHCAEPSSRLMVNKMDSQEVTDIIENTKKLLNKPFSHVIYLSSAALYGDRALEPRHVTDDIYVSDNYCKIKRTAELSVLKTTGTILRLGNVYGVGMSEKNVISTAMQQLFLSNDIEMRTLSPVRDYIWYTDVLDAITKACILRPAGIFNIGSGIGVSVAQLIDEMQLVMNTKLRVKEATPIDEVSCQFLDIDLSVSELGWKPVIEIKQGLKIIKSHMCKESY
jgi:UDP-glucose 4-epimerase